MKIQIPLKEHFYVSKRGEIALMNRWKSLCFQTDFPSEKPSRREVVLGKLKFRETFNHPFLERFLP